MNVIWKDMQDLIEMSSAPGDPPAAIAPLSDWALFLDLDGTLLDLAPTPEAVRAGPRLRAGLNALRAAAGGALAVVTGRRIAVVDALFPGHRFAVAGLHGAEIRPAPGAPLLVPGIAPDAPGFSAARAWAQRGARQAPGLRFEDKTAAFALHYRLAPDHGETVAAIMAEALTLAGPGYKLRSGKAVVELGPADADKGRAVARLMTLPPFAGRRPFAAGDDVTDEDMFRTVNHMGGLTMLVGPASRFAASAAATRLDSPQDFRNWLEGLTG